LRGSFDGKHSGEVAAAYREALFQLDWIDGEGLWTAGRADGPALPLGQALDSRLGAHHAVSHKWLQGYLNEWAWRYNRREDGTLMFRDLIETAASKTAY
jgi:hypothetical protein